VTHRVEHLAEGVTLHLGDAEIILPALGAFDACVTDPPYGIGESAGKAKTRTSGLTSKLKNAQIYRRDYGDDGWDDKPLSPEFMAVIRQSAKWQIIFGGNYYDMPATSCWLVWDKLNGDTDFADCELAWTNLPKAVRRIRFLWNGCMRRERDIAREHPTQKPVDVMKWCIEHLPVPNRAIIDPMMGSGTTGVAAVSLGRSFTGIEREPKYFEIACRRVSEALKAPDLFIESPKPAVQEAFL
jgi:site-specific DNA-methyltransferase (adenine-specific)/modification methylase